jgi:pyridoxal phosphate enzyme (YggS family)
VTPDPRSTELAANLAEVRDRIGAAAGACSRPVDEITLIVVTKTWPIGDVRKLAAIGVTDVGENRDQEAAPKQSACSDLSLRWHFIGGLQRNKCRSVARYADFVHSVDRPELVAALGSAASAAGRQLQICLQVSLDGATGREGADPSELSALADQVLAQPGLRLAGLMTVAPFGADPAATFGRFADIAERFRAAHPGATMLSAGMSQDLETAIRYGATHVRVGTAVLGHRPPLR